jgi:acetolactate synthase-1/2/3 large subunit
MARERLNVVAIIFNNASYAVLNVELNRVGAEEAGPKAKSQLDLHGPVLNFTHWGRAWACARYAPNPPKISPARWSRRWPRPGPHLIEAMVPPSLAGLKLKLLPHILGSLEGLPQPVARFFKRKIAP